MVTLHRHAHKHARAGAHTQKLCTHRNVQVHLVRHVMWCGTYGAGAPGPTRDMVWYVRCRCTWSDTWCGVVRTVQVHLVRHVMWCGTYGAGTPGPTREVVWYVRCRYTWSDTWCGVVRTVQVHLVRHVLCDVVRTVLAHLVRYVCAVIRTEQVDLVRHVLYGVAYVRCRCTWLNTFCVAVQVDTSVTCCVV